MKEKCEFNPSSPEEIVSKLKKLIKKIEDNFDIGMKDFGITHAQFRIIFPIIRDQRGYSMQELSEIVGVDKGFVSRTIADLESKGITQRDKEADSKERNYKIILSEESQQFLAEKMEPHRKQIEKWASGNSKEEILNFIKVLDKLTE